MANYYNENDAYVAAWLRNLISAGEISAGDVDERSIVDVKAADLDSYTQCHFFAGIGGWSLALQLAGWNDAQPVWTGSCPCQAISSAARGRHVAPDMWPVWYHLIAASRPRVLFGEQIAQASRWQDRLGNDLEALGYAFGSAILPAVSVGQDHIRHRFYFVGYADRQGKPSKPIDGKVARVCRDRSVTRSVAQKDGISGRMGRLRSYGNAVVPQVAAALIAAAIEAMSP
jgi:DNA (cytosine-5)-methyltransferase 1